ncbi:MAG: ribonuclease HII [Firmicutes bacterium]|nr:ribonuclease HII [Bacillota bacterium]
MHDFGKMTVEQIGLYLQETELDAAAQAELKKDKRKGVQRLLQKYLDGKEAAFNEAKRLQQLQVYERKLRKTGFSLIAGVDEAGRGPLAGPVIAAAVILPEKYFLPGLNDSKKLPAGKREELYQAIKKTAIAWSVGTAEVFEIDTYNIVGATKLAMQRALSGLDTRPEIVLIDALKLEHLPCPQHSIKGGDRLCASIAAASIIAKVTRDRIMEKIDQLYPGYGFAGHKGYPTRLHREAIVRLGACPQHRKSFLLLPEKEGT